MAAARDVWKYFVTRDSRNGALVDNCDLWGTVKPRREVQDGNVLWVPKASNALYLGEHATSDVRKWFGTVPDTDLELIVIEQYAFTPKPAATAVARRKVSK